MPDWIASALPNLPQLSLTDRAERTSTPGDSPRISALRTRCSTCCSLNSYQIWRASSRHECVRAGGRGPAHRRHKPLLPLDRRTNISYRIAPFVKKTKSRPSSGPSKVSVRLLKNPPILPLRGTAGPCILSRKLPTAGHSCQPTGIQACEN